MKKILIGTALFASVACQTEQHTTIRLHGELQNMGTTKVVMRYRGTASMVGDSRDIVLQTDANGKFDTTLYLSRPEYYDISRNTLYLTPGDDLNVFITQNNGEAIFSGVGAEANNYMKDRLFPKGGSFLEGGKYAQGSFEQCVKTVDSLAALRKQQLADLTGVTERFKTLESARINADIANSYINYFGYARENRALGADERKQKYADFSKQAAPLINPLLREFTDTALLHVAVVRDVLSYGVGERAKTEWFEGVTIPNLYITLSQSYEMVDGLRNKIDKEVIEQANNFISTIKYPEVIAELQHKVNQASKLLPGKQAFDFTYTDIKGNEHKLSQHKGKIIYLDFWATWCGPCIAESPYFEEMSRNYDQSEVVFLPVSTDQRAQVWLDYLSNHDKQLPQYNTTDGILKTGWSIFGIPRFIVIDRDFNIVNAYAPRPSMPEAKILLDSLLTSK
ncbi:MAG: TlpA family protein disulfide reductase [Marinifilaceae bacterium]